MITVTNKEKNISIKMVRYKTGLKMSEKEVSLSLETI